MLYFGQLREYPKSAVFWSLQMIPFLYSWAIDFVPRPGQYQHFVTKRNVGTQRMYLNILPIRNVHEPLIGRHPIQHKIL